MSAVPAEPRVVSGARARAHRDLHAAAARAATGLADLGLSAGTALALLLRNDVAFFEAALAARRIGAFAVPINWHAEAEEIGYIVRDCGAKALVIHADFLSRAVSALPPDLPVVVVETPDEIRTAFGLDPEQCRVPDAAKRWDAWLATFPPATEVAEQSAGVPIIYTSGTTGRPKGVRRTGGASGSAKALKVYGFERECPIRALVTGPMYHSVPNAFARLALAAGADIVLMPRFEPEDLLALIASHQITHMHITPAMMAALLRLPDTIRRQADVSSLVHVVHGAAPCPASVKAAMIDWWGPVVCEYYGSTETGLLTFADPHESDARPGTVGRALPGIALKIFDRDGAELPPGTAGRVFAGSDRLHAFTYIGRQAERDAIGQGDLVTAGDIGRLDADGHLYLLGRTSDLIQIGDRAIAAADVEAVLMRSGDVRDCAAFGLPTADGEIVCACVAVVDGASPDMDTMRAAVCAALDLSEPMLRIEIVDTLPREDSGKVFKRRLLETFR